jgi:putative oxidoreductase
MRTGKRFILNHMKPSSIMSLILRVVAAIIMLQTLYFKFTAHPESIYIFSTVGIEPWGRIATGIAELVASVLLLLPRTVAVGALLTTGIMMGALLTHLLILGIEVQGDGGQLFIYAVVAFVSGLILLRLHFNQLTTNTLVATFTQRQK